MHSDKPSIHERANGRWPGILSAFGFEAALLNTRKHHPCPWCGGKDRFRFTDKDGSGSFFCGQCGQHSAMDILMHRRGWDFATAAREVEAVLGEVPVSRGASKGKSLIGIKRLWQMAEPASPGDFVDRYLLARGISLPSYPDCLRRLPTAEHLDENKHRTIHPAMLAKIVDPDGKGTNVHRTYLTNDGRKADVKPDRKMMFGDVAAGSAVRLFEQEGDTLGIAEGIETALSAAALFNVPVWSAINTSILKAWAPPKSVKSVIVFADNDENCAGQLAAYALVARLRKEGFSASVQMPPLVNQDWNDVLRQKKGIAA